jgi:diaminohydroxyphosphoribosylaminopyrimidine deaminase/5-amino-6-(5-phosphoribosylamino)uracil reductase
MLIEKDTDYWFMLRCLELAAFGKGNTYPNPLVGSVITHKNMIIGEGYHREYGKAHAEVNAIETVENKSQLKNSTLYVNLEPCCHVGQTPPCTDLIIHSGIPRIVIGSADPNPAITGRGINTLKSAGCDVTIGILDSKNRELNRSFFSYHEKKRPYVILKWAESNDGFLDQIRTPDMQVGPNWITGEIEQILVHKWRAEEQAIMVGSRTATIDNPSLTARQWTGRQPLRITISRKANLAENLHLIDKQNRTLIYTERELPPDHEIIYVKLDYTKDIPGQIMGDLYNREIQSLIVEGGKELLESFIFSEIWDEAMVFKGIRKFNEGIRAPKIESKPKLHTIFGQCELKYYRNFSFTDA